MRPPYLGHCLCGQIKFQLTSEPLTLYACHCTDCQRRSGGALLLSCGSIESLLRPGMLEQAKGFAPIAHQYVRSALPWFVFPEGVRRYETAPEDPAELVRLWREARERGGHGSREP